MGILKFTAKTIGTVALTAFGVTSHVANMIVNACSGGEDAPLLTTIEDSSFEAIKKMWHPEEYAEELESGELDNATLQRRIDAKYNALQTLGKTIENLKKMQDKAYQSGTESDVEKIQTKIDELQEKRDQLYETIRNLEEELKEQKQMQ